MDHRRGRARGRGQVSCDFIDFILILPKSGGSLKETRGRDMLPTNRHKHQKQRSKEDTGR